MLAGDVDRHIGDRMVQGVEHQPRLLAGAGPELHQRRAPADGGGDLAGAVAQDRELGAGGVVLEQFADLVEQVRAALVIEEASGDGLLRAGQPLHQGVGETLLHGREVVQRDPWGDRGSQQDIGMVVHLRPLHRRSGP